MSQTVPTYKQRVHLQALSAKLWGSSNRWLKAQAQIYIPTATLDEEATTDPDQPKFKMSKRTPDLNEMIQIMERWVGEKEFQDMPKDKRLATMAQQFVDKTLKLQVIFPLKEADLPEAEELYGMLDVEVAERVKALVVGENDQAPGAFMIPALEFLTELAYLKDPSLREPAAAPEEVSSEAQA